MSGLKRQGNSWEKQRIFKVSFGSAVDELVQSLIEKLNQDMLEDTPDAVVAILQDRDSLMQSVQNP